MSDETHTQPLQNVQIVIQLAPPTDKTNELKIPFVITIGDKVVPRDEMYLLEPLYIDAVKLMLNGVFQYIGTLDDQRQDKISDFIKLVEKGDKL